MPLAFPPTCGGRRELLWGLLAMAALAMPARAARISVQTPAELRQSVLTLQPGDTLLIAPGTYNGDLNLAGLRGTANAPITLQGADNAARPLFQNGRVALRLSDCHYVRLRYLQITGFPQHGIVIGEDAKAIPSPCDHIIVEDLSIVETGARGLQDALHLIGVTDFIVNRCSFESWGDAGVNIKDCQRGVIQGCEFFGREGSDQATGMLIHGGSRAILVQTSFFRWAGNRSLSIGSGRDTPLQMEGKLSYSATAVEVAGNRFFGSLYPITWAAADGGHVHHNTIVLPQQSVAQILQENADSSYGSCRNGFFERNLIVVDQRVFQAVRVEDGTELSSFVFSENVWFRSVGNRPIKLPVLETNGVMQVDPQIPIDGPTAFRMGSDDPRLAGRGADAYEPQPLPFAFPN